jgi:peptidoglycan/xylan/chitin deacetylase (PgdA/CDA1 family)
MKAYKGVRLITSWDDGNPLDLKLAELLEKYKIPGIFYIPITNQERNVMTKSQIRQLSKNFEIGGHTYSHADLATISLKEAKTEIERGKIELENIIGKKVERFSYPWGKYNDPIKRLVKKAGFKEARTARIIFIGENSDPFETNPNLHVHNHSKFIYLAHCLKNMDFKTALTVSKLRGYNFDKVAEQLFKSGFHMWGHSWELEREKLWGQLTHVLISVKQFDK